MDLNQKLSEHFTLNELINSPTAISLGIAEQFEPPADIQDNLKALCVNVLEPVRALIGFPITVSSGWRCEALNKAVGGEQNPLSQHCFGNAADISCVVLSVKELYEKIKKSNIHFDKLIIEHNKDKVFWVHIQWNPAGAQRGLCMIGSLRPGGGTDVVEDGYGAFKNIA